MGKIDISAGHYISQGEVFADICNYALFDGRQKLKPEDLAELDTQESGMPYGKEAAASIIPVKKYRDILKNCIIRDAGVASVVLVGIENQSEIHYAMPVKNMVYDALDYASQVDEMAKLHRKNKDKWTSAEFLSGLKKGEKLKPVVTLVLYLGAEVWDGPRNLAEMLDIEEPHILNLINNYKINLIVPQEIEDFEKFHSDLRYVLKFLKVSNDKAAIRQLLEEEKEAFSKMDIETAYLIGRYSNIAIKSVEEGEKVNMCKGVEDMLEESRSEGEAKGEYKKLVAQVCRKLKKNCDIKTIAEMLEEEEQIITNICMVAERYAPEYDAEQVFAELQK